MNVATELNFSSESPKQIHADKENTPLKNGNPSGLYKGTLNQDGTSYGLFCVIEDDHFVAFSYDRVIICTGSFEINGTRLSADASVMKNAQTLNHTIHIVASFIEGQSLSGTTMDLSGNTEINLRYI